MLLILQVFSYPSNPYDYVAKQIESTYEEIEKKNKWIAFRPDDFQKMTKARIDNPEEYTKTIHEITSIVLKEQVKEEFHEKDVPKVHQCIDMLIGDLINMKTTTDFKRYAKACDEKVLIGVNLLNKRFVPHQQRAHILFMAAKTLLTKINKCKREPDPDDCIEKAYLQMKRIHEDLNDLVTFYVMEFTDIPVNIEECKIKAKYEHDLLKKSDIKTRFDDCLSSTASTHFINFNILFISLLIFFINKL